MPDSSNVQLYCTSSGLPATAVQWSKGDGSSLSGLSSTQVITDAANAVYFNERVVSASEADSIGSFKCTVTARNEISGAMATANITFSTGECGCLSNKHYWGEPERAPHY